MCAQPFVLSGRIKLRDFAADFHGGIKKKKAKAESKKAAERISELQEVLYAQSNQAVLLVFQGLDASGKDGVISHVLHYVNPAGVETANFKVPSATEAAHDYLWRVHTAVPRFGRIGVFNRSHYEAVLAERVLRGLRAKVLEARYRQIRDFERMLIENGIVLLKFYLHLSRGEQARRFRERLTLPRKKWKFSTGDLAVRSRWDDYERAYEDMLSETSFPGARWHLVPADHKWYRNWVVSRRIVQEMEGLDLRWPAPTEDLSRIKIR